MIFAAMLRKALPSLTFCLLGLVSSHQVAAQLDSVSSVFGKGIQLAAKDSSFYLKVGFRIQPNYTGIYTDKYYGADGEYSQRFSIRRSRLKFDGWAFSPKVVYKFEFDLVGGYIRDAALKWNFAGRFNLWFGQAKLPGNRQRVVSSQNMELVDRSLLNGMTTIDRDRGFQLHHWFMIGSAQFKWALALSQGDGIRGSGFGKGAEYTARMDFLPLGKFKNKGDYVEADIYREEHPKLSIGATLDYNQSAKYDRGTWGKELSEFRDMQGIFIDALIKYRGMAISGEYAHKKVTDGSPSITDTTGAVVQSFITGQGINLQAGYVFKCNWQVVGAYSFFDPESATQRPLEQSFTLGLSKYIVGHNLKVQWDNSIFTKEDSADRFITRLQMELAF